MPQTDPAPRDLVRHVAGFLRVLRWRGWRVGPGESELALRALRCLGVRERLRVMHGLRAVLARSRSQWAEFPGLFAGYWQPGGGDSDTVPGQDPGGPGDADATPAGPEPEPAGASTQHDTGETDEPASDVPTYSPAVLLMRKDLGTMPEANEAALADFLQRLADSLKVRRRRRLRRAGRRGSVDLRRAFRRSLRWGGELLELPRRSRREEVGGVVVLCDVSGSMEAYGRLYLQFLHGLHRHLRRVDAFAFSTHLIYVSPLMSRLGWRETWQGLRQRLDNWSGGTRIADCLGELRTGFSHLLRSQPALLIVSDGLDTGDPDRVAAELAYLRQVCGQILWLNPLAAHPQFEPLARGMAAALPYLARLGAGHNLEVLIQALAEAGADLYFPAEVLP